MSNKWHVGKLGATRVYGEFGEVIAEVPEWQHGESEAKALAAQIVREHNAHDDLVAALRDIARAARAARAALAKAGAA